MVLLPSRVHQSPPDRIVPVLDLQGGRAVHARGGDRCTYLPLVSRLVDPPDRASDPLILAESYRRHLGHGVIYVADLDAIAGSEPDRATLCTLIASGSTPWLDAGVRSAVDLDGRHRGLIAVMGGSTRWVIGSESVAGPEALSELVGRLGAERVVFSLDLDGPRVRLGTRDGWTNPDRIESVVEDAIGAGIVSVLMLDLSRVGMGSGPLGVERLTRWAREYPEIAWLTGGGIRSKADAQVWLDAGASAVLVGTALHQGQF